MKEQNKIFDIVEGELPEWIINYWKEATKSIDCNPNFTFTALLGMGSIAIGKSAKIEPKPYYSLYPSLFLACVGKASTKKTPSIRAMIAPIIDIQKENKQEFVRLRTEYIQRKNEGDEELPPYPVFKLSFLTDTTMESMSENLSKSQNQGILVNKAELAGFFKGLNQYKSGGGDLQYVLELYDNETILITRKSLDVPIQVEEPFISIIGGLQPSVLGEVFKTTDVGLVERFCFTFGMPNEKRSAYSRDVINFETMGFYKQGMIDLYRNSERMVAKGEVHTYRFTEEADILWEKWQNEMEYDEDLESMIQKAFARCAKFSLIIEILNHPQREIHQVSEKSLKFAIKLTEMYIENHKTVLNYLEDGELVERFNKMISYLKKQFRNPKILSKIDGFNAIEIRRIYSNKAGGTKGNKDATYEILELLEQKGYGKIVPRNPKSTLPKSFHFYPKFWK